MIIGNNSNSSFNHNTIPKYNNKKNDNSSTKLINSKPIQNHYSNPLNKNEMADKTYHMLEERYKNGLISLEEFHKQCNKLSKFRNKWKNPLNIHILY